MSEEITQEDKTFLADCNARISFSYLYRQIRVSIHIGKYGWVERDTLRQAIDDIKKEYNERKYVDFWGDPIPQTVSGKLTTEK